MHHVIACNSPAGDRETATYNGKDAASHTTGSQETV